MPSLDFYCPIVEPLDGSQPQPSGSGDPQGERFIYHSSDEERQSSSEEETTDSRKEVT